MTASSPTIAPAPISGPAYAPVRPALRVIEGGSDGPVGIADPTTREYTTLRLLPTRRVPTALIADDDERTLALLSYYLGPEFDVLVARDGEEALRMALVEQPDLILLGVRVPKLDGFEVTRQIRRNAYTCEIPLILLDHHPERIDTLRGLAVGADDYIAKPLEPGFLIARIRDLLEQE